MKRLRMVRNGYILFSVAFYVLGALLILAPDIPPAGACAVGGVVLVAYGAVKLAGYWSDDLYCLAFQHDLAHGLLLLIVGALVLACNLRLADCLIPGLGGLILLDGLLSVQTVKDAREFGLERWPWMLGLAIAACLLGALVIAAPPDGGGHVQSLAGSALIAVGGMRHFVVWQTVSLHRRSAQDP